MAPTDGSATILVVDDEEAIRNAVRRYLAQQGFRVITAATGEEALGCLLDHPIAGILLDVNLPGASGVELVPRLLSADPSVAIVMLTAVNDATTAALCMQRGALDYLIKPVDLAHLRRAVAAALARRRALIEQRRTTDVLREAAARRDAERRTDQTSQERISLATLEALVNALEAKHPDQRGHSERVADLSALVAAQLGCGDEEVQAVRIAGRLHDIGKIGVRDEILYKEGPLTDEEFDHVKRHVVVGSEILAPLAHLRPVVAYVRSHHERWDGFGYPDRLAGEAIPLGARIIAAVETFDALTTSRSYQEKMSPEVAVDRMRDLVGTALDPAVHHALEAVITHRRAPAT